MGSDWPDGRILSPIRNLTLALHEPAADHPLDLLQRLCTNTAAARVRPAHCGGDFTRSANVDDGDAL